MDVLTTRIEALERSVCSAKADPPTANLAEQVAQIERQLGRTLADHTSLAQALKKYEGLRDVIEGDGDLELSRRLLGVTAKAELILLNDDTAKIMTDLHTISDLQPRINQPEYATAAKLASQLNTLEQQHGEQAAAFKQVVADMSSAVDRYHAETDALSEIFLRWDRVLTSVERKVAELEATRQK